MSLVQEIKVPLVAVNDTSLTVVEINFTNGDHVRKGEVVMVFETSKTTYDVPAESDGYIQYHCETGNDYEVNDIVARIYSEASETIPQDLPAPASSQVTTRAAPKVNIVPDKEWEGETIFSAEAETLIAARNIDRALFGGKDLVSKQDVEQLLGISTAAAPRPAAAKAPAAPKQKTVTVDPSKIVVEKLTAAKKREIEYLGDVQSTGLTSTINTYVETAGLFVHVNQSLKYLKNSLLPLIVYESARLLKKFPMLNACYTEQGIGYYHQVNPGFAADMGQGLKVLKIANAYEKNLDDIESDILQLSERYLDNTLSIDDLTDITFTITDLSAEGVAFFRPLVNTMNSAILGISSIDEKLNRCTLSLTFDHRVTEGKPVAQFLQQLKERLESYRSTAVHNVSEISCYKCGKGLAEDLGKMGFVKCVTQEGKEEYLCQSCLKGF